MPGFLTNGVPTAKQIGGKMYVPVDTELPSGANPQTVAAATFQIAGTLTEALSNTATSTAGAATQNTLAGIVTTEALATASGASYTFTLTNNQINAAYLASGQTPIAGLFSISNTGGQVAGSVGAVMQLVSTTLAVGSAVFVFQNLGGTALNGTMSLVWHL